MSLRALEAAVFDLDGVVTRTASVHFAAWKQLFDALLEDRGARPGEDHQRFDETDYRAYVDGRPRLEGIRTFLAARHITLPEGTPDDAPGTGTIAALGKQKQTLYLAQLDRLGIEVDPDAVALVRALRAAGVRVGVATSSRNAPLLLQRAGLEGLFEARVDGTVSAALGLRGKPHPDAILECLRRLGAGDPGRALLIEDAASGVEAGKAAGLGLVLGLDRGGNWLRLREAGADRLLQGLDEVSVDSLDAFLAARPHLLPNALHAWPALARTLRGERLAVFLDYDGTLTPIVDRPEEAILDDDTRHTLQRLAAVWPTQIISGRGLEDVQRRVGIGSLWMAGSHGFDIAAPEGSGRERGSGRGLQIAPQLEPEVHAAGDALRLRTAGIPGVLVEDKRFALAVHYRLVDAARVPALERRVDEVLTRYPALRKSHGKKVFQVQPAMAWDKGQALRWLLEATGQRGALPLYLGDDATDEDAFAVVRERGLGILVTETPRPTAARYALQNPFEVELFLERVTALGSAALAPPPPGVEAAR